MRTRETSPGRTILLLLLVCLVLIPASPSAGAPGTVTLKVAFTPLSSWGPLFIADTEGFFSREGIKVEWVTFAGAADTVAILAQGGLDVAAGAASAGFFNAVAGGVRVRIVADKGHVEPGFREIALVVRKGLKGDAAPTLMDLKGRKVAVNTIGSVVHYLLARSLARVGLGLKDVEIVRMPFPSMVAALQQGGIDGAVLAEPFVTQVVEMGVGTILLTAGSVAPDEPIAFIFYGPHLLERAPDLGRRFMVAYLRGTRQYAEGPTERNIRIIANYTKIEIDVVRKAGWFPISADGRVNIDKIRRFQDWLYDQELIGVRLPLTSLVDLSFIEYANQALQGR